MSAMEHVSVWDCPVFQDNIIKNQKINQLMIRNFGVDLLSGLSFNKDFQKKDLEFVMSKSHIYTDDFDRLSKKYNFPSDHKSDIQMMLELSAYSYLLYNSVIILEAPLHEIEQDLNDLKEQIEKFRYALKPLSNYGNELDPLFGKPSVSSTLGHLNKNLNELYGLKARLRKSFVGKRAHLGVKASLGNPGLPEYILHLHTLWTGLLNRSLQQSYDGINGRKQFLEFLKECAKPLHQELPHETIDNALSKFVRNLKATNVISTP